MESVKKINLIQTKLESSPEVGLLATLLRKLSLWALLLLIISGIITIGTYYYMLVRRDQLVSTKQRLTEIIAQNPTKEGLLLSVQQRTALITKILAFQKPVGTVFDIVSAFISGSQILRMTLDDKNMVFLSFHAQSITDVISISDTLIKQTASNLVKNPQLDSLIFSKDGGIDIMVSFIPIF